MSRKNKISFFIIFVLLFNIIFSNSINVQAVTTADISYAVNSSIKVGDNFLITVNTSSVTDLYGASIDFQYDTSLFSITSVDEGSVFTQSGLTVLNPVNSNLNGHLSFAEILQGNTSGVNSSGSLFIIHAKVLKAGTVTLNTINDNSDLSLTGNNVRIMLSDSNGDPITYTNTVKAISIATGYKGWYQLNGKWYYADPNTGVNITGWLPYGGKWYYMDNSGAMQTGWIYNSGKWYYSDNNGVMQTGWFNYGGNWYYLSSGGSMLTGWFYDSGKWYYSDNNGVMQTGWLNYGGNWYYLSSGGSMLTGWIYDSGKWYYSDSNGVMQTGWLNYGGNWYYLSSGGSMITGWIYYGGNWYYLSSGGSMMTGWIYYGGNWYYLYSSGIMAANTIIDGYRLGSDGVWIP